VKIIWSEKALTSLQKIIEHLNDDWSVKIVNEFLDAMDSAIDYIQNHPEIGERFEESAYRQLLITKHTYLFYRIDYEKEDIYLNYLWGTIDDPEKLAIILFS